MQPLCKHFGACGGCDFQDIPYSDQLKNKELRIREIFSQFEVEKFDSIVPSPQIFYYRNKMEYAVSSDASDLYIGLRAKKRFYRIVNLEECRIFNQDVKKIFDTFREWIGTCGVEPYQLRRHSGTIRYAALRHSKYYNELMVIVVLTSGAVKIEPLVDRLKEIGNVKSVYLCINENKADVSITDNLTLVYGDKFIKERINGIDYSISPDSFFQTNPYCCSELYSVIKKEASGLGGSALDICCGSGGITLQIASSFDNVVGVDISARNIEDAAINAGANGIKNAEFIREDAEKFILKYLDSRLTGNFSTIILDPPRAGLSKKLRLAICESSVKNVIYVSCNPINLAEDLKVIRSSYHIEKLIPVDMFPHTRHVEIVAILRANKV